MLQLGICIVRFVSALINKVSKTIYSAHLLRLCQYNACSKQRALVSSRTLPITVSQYHPLTARATWQTENSSERQHFAFSNAHMA